MAEEPDELVTAMAWYAEEDWERLREVSADAETLEDNWEEWKEHAIDEIERLREAGYEVRRIEVDPDELQAWCSVYDRPVDGHARSVYATSQMREESESEGDA